MRSEVVSQEDNILVLQVEEDAQEFDGAVRAAVRDLSKQANIKGFRKGRVPRHVLEMYVGKKAIIDQAVENVMPSCMERLLEEYGVVLLEDPKIDMEQAEEGKPFVFKATLYTRPEIILPEPEEIAVKRPVFPVLPEDVENTVEKLRHQHAEWIPVEDDDTEATADHVVDVSYVITVDGEESERQEEVPIALWAQELREEIKEALTGQKKGNSVNVDIPIPEDHEDEKYAGKTASYAISVKQVKQEKLAELDEEFFKKVAQHETFESEEEFRGFIEDQLTARAAGQSDKVAEDRVLKAFVDATEISVLPERELERQYQSIKNEEGAKIEREFKKSVEEYLESQNVSMEDYEKHLREEAEAALRIRFAFDVFAEEEGVEVANEDVEKEMRGLAARTGMGLKELYELHRENRNLLMDMLSRLRFRKAVDLLMTRVTVEDVDAEEEMKEMAAQNEAEAAEAPEEKPEA